MVQINNLSYKYRSQSNNVFSSLNLTLEKGHIYGLLGRNGVGKSTLLYNILGLQKPTSGSITYEAIDATGNTTTIHAHKRNAEILQECFAVTEVFELPAYSLKKYISIYSPFYPRFSETQFEQYMQTFNLSTEIKNLTHLSMGEQKKVYISFALACNTSLLIMDEPTNGLDIPAKAEFRKNISLAMNDNRCMIISTHQVADIENILDNVTIMDKNGIILNDSLYNIGNSLLFGENQPYAIYTQPSPAGFYTISPNRENQESVVRLELLFNALHSDKAQEILALIKE